MLKKEVGFVCSRMEVHCTSASVRDVKKQCCEIIQHIMANRSLQPGNSKWLLCNREVPSRLQGKFPRCGLSALSMANDLLRHPDDLSLKPEYARHEQQELDSLLKLAQLRGFSEHGEMYSAENLAELAKEFYGHNCVVLNGALNDGNFIVSEIMRGSAVLVPYDADKNHEPCQQNGHRAHWALVTGVLCELHGNSYQWKVCQQDAGYPTLFHAFPSSDISLPKNCQAQHIHLCAKHGKSRHTAVWPMTNVANSNANLFELDPNKMRNGSFVVPEEGLFVGLCGKIVVISNQR